MVEMKRFWIILVLQSSVLQSLALVGREHRGRNNHSDLLVANGLSWKFYDESCPDLESIVKDRIEFHLSNDVTQSAGLLRLHFHDCFVQGCDGSVLLNGSTSSPSEQSAIPNLTLRPEAFAIINDIKQFVETLCPQTVSCTDIVALASRESVWRAGGPFIPLPLGRRDSLKLATVNETLRSLPAPNFNTSQLLDSFADQSLDVVDLVALSGGHTIGVGHCPSFKDRLYPVQDPILEDTFADFLYTVCPTSNSNNNASNDVRTPSLFDNKYYADLISRDGLFSSDQALYTDRRTRDLVELFSADEDAFFEQFTVSMIRMSQLNVLTGTQGEIREHCNFRNPSISVDTYKEGEGEDHTAI